jgi:hypothetical protein
LAHGKDLEFVIGEFQLAGAGSSFLVPGEKTVTLDLQQFMQLCGLAYNEMTTFSKNPKLNTGTLSSMHHLGRDYYFCWTSLHCSPLAHIREYHRKANNDIFPTPNGICLSSKSFDSFKASIQDGSFMSEIIGVLKRRDPAVIPTLPAPDTSGLSSGLPFVLFTMFLERLQQECSRCQDLAMMFRYPLRHDPRHICRWSTNPIELSALAKEEIMRDLVNSKKIEGILLILKPYGALSNFDNLKAFDIDGYLSGNEEMLWKKVEAIIQQELKAPLLVSTGSTDDEIKDLDPAAGTSAAGALNA